MYEKFSSYESQYDISRMTEIRNNADARTLICEVAASLALCRKSKLPAVPKIKPEHDFKQATVTENLKSPSANYARHLAKLKDPLELYIPLNELVYCMRPETRDVTRSIYWVAWILKYSSQYKKQNKTDLVCSPRPNDYIDSKSYNNAIWLIWDAVLDAAKSSPQSGLLNQYIDALYKIHCLRWQPSILKQRLCFLVVAIQYICESTTLDIHYGVPNNITTIHEVVGNIPQWIQAIIQTQKTFS
jgi:hypothetical protein